MRPSPGEELETITANGLRRHLRVLDSAQGDRVVADGRALRNFSSNDYLGLAGHPALVDAATRAAATFGFGAGASRLVCGTMRPHAALEEALAAFKSAQAALVFGSGFAAGTGVIPAILDKGDVVVLDKLSHACLIDGARASGATLRVYGHNRVDQLEDILRASRAKSPEARILVVTESVFSMDGDSCPLAEIVEAKDRHGAWLLLDEAHATGVIGPGGRGLAAALGLSSRIEFQMGTLSKALGCHGGFVAASRVMVDLLINRCRPFIYATAPPPLISAACLAALEICSSGEGDQRRVALDANRLALARVLRAPQPSISPIFPFIVGAEDEAVALAASLLDAGILAPAIRYPTVAKGSARLRFTVTAGHQPDDFAALGAAITACGQV